MTKQKQATVDQPDSKRQRRVEPASVAGPMGDLVSLVDLPGAFITAAAGGTIQSQAARLGDPRLQSVQRQALASQVGQMQGNGHLRRVIASIRGNGNTPSTGWAVQRRAVRAVIGTTLGTISFRAPGYVPAEGRLTVQTEIVPDGERPGRFRGYRNRVEAYAQAWRQETVCAVGEDREGRFHTLKTDWPLRSPQTSVTIIPTRNALFGRLWWVERPTEQGQVAAAGPGSWAQRVSRARDWYSSWNRHTIPQGFPAACQHEPRHGSTLGDLRRCLETEFVDLLAEALAIGRNEIYVARSKGDRNPSALVTFDIEMTPMDALGRGGIGRLPTTRTARVPRPSVAVGPGAFRSESRLHLLGTVIHESGHYAHGARAVELLERWRRSRSRRTLQGWLQGELRARRISQVEYDLAVERIHGGEDVTETLVRLEAFTSIYHRLPITSTAYRFTQIDGMAEYWLRAGHRMNNESMRQLATYYRGLDATHQADFAAHARRAQASFHDRDRGLFWDRVVRDVLGH